MQLPHADQAVVEEAKVRDYLLNSMHPDRAPKARFFQSLGYDGARWGQLAQALRDIAQSQPVRTALETEHGHKYIIEGTISSPAGNSACVRTIWIVDKNSTLPRLITAYPCR